MSATYGNKLKVTIFGESHGECVGAVIDGFPAGFDVNMDFILTYLKRRAPGGALSTSRTEADVPKVYSGLLNGRTTGAPICVVFENTNNRSGDYPGRLVSPRPSHADYAAYLKYNGNADIRGGGYYSGRLTAGMVFTGALCADYMRRQYNVHIGAHIRKLGGVEDFRFDGVNPTTEMFDSISVKELAFIDDCAMQSAVNLLQKVKVEGDSVGAVIECAVINLPPSLGTHMFDSVESALSAAIFGIPGAKGIEFGAGFGFADMMGSGANDSFYYEGSAVKTISNHSGGIQGGMTYGMPVIFSVAFKPTPSIFLEQDTVDLSNKLNVKYQIKGRHDPCIAVRAVPVVECSAAVAMLDLILRDGNNQ